MQLELFNEPMYKNDYIYLFEKCERLRKSQHARITVLQKEVRELREQLEFLISNICTGNIELKQVI